MHKGQFIFAQILSIISRYEFQKCVDRYQGDHRTRSFSCWTQFLAMIFAQLTYRDSLRDIESCLGSRSKQLYHMGIRGVISRSTLADANENRCWRIWADLAMVLIAKARQLHAGDQLAMRLKASVYVFDTTTIDLCLNLFPWATFRRRKGAIKLHTLIDLRGNIPCFINVSQGSMHEVNALDDLNLEPGSYYIMDRGFVDFKRLYRFETQRSFFVIRAKDNLNYVVSKSNPSNRKCGFRADQIIRLRGFYARKDYPCPLRRISYIDRETGLTMVFLTNQFDLSASTIALLYKNRWQVELFFKWIKQYLRIKTFYGNSANAVKSQIWIAICTYTLVVILRRQLGITQSMGEILQVLSLMLFDKTPVFEVFSKSGDKCQQVDDYKFLSLFDF